MGRHAAADGAPADPLVTAALAQRAAEAAGHDAVEIGEPGGLGWPGPPAPGDGRTGWPGRDVDDVPPVPEPVTAPEPAPTEGRRGWWRLFGPRAA